MPEAEADLEWTQSSSLLDDLDISKESIFKSISRSQSLSSSLYKLHQNRETNISNFREIDADHSLTHCKHNKPTSFVSSPHHKDMEGSSSNHKAHVKKCNSEPDLSHSKHSRSHTRSPACPCPPWCHFHPEYNQNSKEDKPKDTDFQHLGKQTKDIDNSSHENKQRPNTRSHTWSQACPCPLWCHFHPNNNQDSGRDHHIEATFNLWANKQKRYLTQATITHPVQTQEVTPGVQHVLVHFGVTSTRNTIRQSAL
jgi:hypothetical protein